jgi:hypothetical protein
MIENIGMTGALTIMSMNNASCFAGLGTSERRVNQETRWDWEVWNTHCRPPGLRMIPLTKSQKNLR